MSWLVGIMGDARSTSSGLPAKVQELFMVFCLGSSILANLECRVEGVQTFARPPRSDWCFVPSEAMHRSSS